MKILITFSFVLFQMVSFCQSFHSINDSLFEHLDDVKISFFKDTFEKGKDLIRLQLDDSTYLFKEYQNNTLLSSYVTNIDGVPNGGFFYYNLRDSSKVRGIAKKGVQIYKVKVDFFGDTLEKKTRIKDSNFMQESFYNGIKKTWFTNHKNLKNGHYVELDIKTLDTLVIGQFKIIKREDVIDMKELNAKAREYDIYPLVFLGSNGEASIPVGKWTISKTSKEKLDYNWEGCFVISE